MEDNMRVVRRGFEELQEVRDKKVTKPEHERLKKESNLPIMLKRTPAGTDPKTDIHRFGNRLVVSIWVANPTTTWQTRSMR